MLNLAEYRHRSQSLADFLPWAALVARGRRPQQGRLVPAHGAVPRARSRFRDAGRAGRASPRGSTMRCAVSAPAGRSSSRPSAMPAQQLSAQRFSRSGLGAGRCRAPRAVRGGRRAFREPLFPDAALAAAGRRRRARRSLALRGPGARRRRLARGARRLRRSHRPRARTWSKASCPRPLAR